MKYNFAPSKPCWTSRKQRLQLLSLTGNLRECVTRFSIPNYYYFFYLFLQLNWKKWWIRKNSSFIRCHKEPLEIFRCLRIYLGTFFCSCYHNIYHTWIWICMSKTGTGTDPDLVGHWIRIRNTVLTPWCHHRVCW